MALRMGYEHDIFLSYTTRDPVGKWVHKHFRPLLEGHLTYELGREVKIFVDEKDILAGEAWPNRLKRALADSRCLIAIWSPLYFNSSWCMEECAVMFHREVQLGYRTIDNPSGLILPVITHDGHSFPKFARQVQYLNCKDYILTGEGFSKTEKYAQFEEKIRSWTQEVAQTIKNAPIWLSEWRNEVWINEAISSLPESYNPAFPLPVLE